MNVRRRPSPRTRRGTSLVEALVAMAVMALGMLAVVGIQSTLRLNADVAKQRSEAVRIAQEAMESARGFSAIEAPGQGQTAYDAVVSSQAQAVEGYTTNTTYTVTRSVVTDTNAPRKEIRIRVQWEDRSGQVQAVELSSIVGANDPRLALLMGARPNGIPVRQPLGRHEGIPPSAKALPQGISVFKPPAPGGQVVWVFDNSTGVITSVCSGVLTEQSALTEDDLANCSTDVHALLLAGFIRFATGTQQPTAADAENPAGQALNLELNLTLSSTGHPYPYRQCFAAAPVSQSLASLFTDVPYFCIVYVNEAGQWSGRSTVVPLAFLESPEAPWLIAENAADASVDRYRVCRYTPASSDSVKVPNRDHPRNYIGVNTPLWNQNFLVIRAGDGTQAFTCPVDSPINPAAGDLVNSNTLVHQPDPN